MKLRDHLKRLKGIWRPEMFQGWGRKKRYFEGWYYKIITADQKSAMAIIPGISYSDLGNHAFIQTMDGVRNTSKYVEFPQQDFQSADDKFLISLNKNTFSDQALTLDLAHLHGTILFENIVPFRGSFLSPGIMGWYSFMPFMQCNHGLVSMNHQLSGVLFHEGQPIDFTGGKGYIEKDWGSSFPLAWVWTQCNHYDAHDDLSIMASVAHIPWLGSYFIGFLAIVYYKQKMKIFTTYSRAKMHLDLREDEVEMVFWDHSDRLTITAQQAEGTDLISPRKGSMTGKVNESIQATHLVILDLDGQEIRAQGTSAGLEVGGNSLILLQEKKA